MQYDIQYRVDEKNKVVVATADFHSELDKLFDKKFKQTGNVGMVAPWFPFSFPFSVDDFYRTKDFYRVVARCHGDDVFDEETGKKICRQKLKAKFYKIFNIIVKNYNNYLFRNLLETMDYLQKNTTYDVKYVYREFGNMYDAYLRDLSNDGDEIHI